MVGFPVVPGGHTHSGRFLDVIQSAFVPHNPWKQRFIHRRLKQVVPKEHSLLLTHPAGLGIGVGTTGGVVKAGSAGFGVGGIPRGG